MDVWWLIKSVHFSCDDKDPLRAVSNVMLFSFCCMFSRNKLYQFISTESTS